MNVKMEPIGFAYTDARDIPRYWTVSDVEGTLVIDKKYLEGLRDIQAGQHIVVIFQFHQSPKFSREYLRQIPRRGTEKKGVFSICSPVRPNPIGISVLEVLKVKDNILHVKGMDMLNGTPILDIKPHIKDKHRRDIK